MDASTYWRFKRSAVIANTVGAKTRPQDAATITDPLFGSQQLIVDKQLIYDCCNVAHDIVYPDMRLIFTPGLTRHIVMGRTIMTRVVGFTVTLPVVGSAPLLIDWGDGSTPQTYTPPAPATYTFLSPGTYLVSITGDMTAFGLGSTSWPGVQWLTEAISWGASRFQSLSGAFAGASNLTAVPRTVPSSVTNMSYMFAGATAFMQDISPWSVPNVTSAQGMLTGVPNTDITMGFPNIPVSSYRPETLRMTLVTPVNANVALPLTLIDGSANIIWDDGVVTTGFTFTHTYVAAGTYKLIITANLGGFGGAAWVGANYLTALTAWGGSNMTSLAYAFNLATALTSVATILPSVTDMSYMFAGASAFNGVGIGAWNMSNVTNVSRMFSATTAAYSGSAWAGDDLTVWSVPAVTSRAFFFSSTGSADTSTSDTKSPFFTMTAPTTPIVGAITPTSVALSWTKTVTITPTDTKIEYNSGSGWSTWVNPAGLLGAATSAIVTGLSPATNYTFRVSTKVNALTSPPSATAAAQTTISPPTNLIVTSFTATTVTLFWTNVSTPTDTTIQYQIAGAGGWTTWAHTPVLGTATSATVTGLSPATNYNFQVLSVTAVGTSSPSNIATAATTVAPPTGLSVGAVTTSTVALTWTNGSTPTDTLVEYQPIGGSWTTWNHSSLGAAAAATVTGLSSGVSYSFRVSTITAAGTSSPSSTASANTVVAVPTGLMVGSVTTTTIDLSWTNPPSITPTDVLIEYNTGSSWSTWSHSPAITGPYTTVTDLMPSVTYTFRVSNVVGANTSTPSSSSSPATTLAAAIPPPTGLSVNSFTYSTASLSWTNSATPTSTTVQYQIGSGSWTTWSPSPSGSATSVTITGLLAETLYNFRVTTNTATGSSVPSATASTTTAVVPAPTGLSTGTVTTSTVALSWTNNATATDTLVEYNGGSGWATWSHASLGTATSTTVTGLLSSTSYSFRVSTISAAGTSAPSGTASATTATTTVPPPTGLSVTSFTYSTASLSWTNNVTPTTTLVEYQAGSGSWNTWSPAPIGSATTVTVTGLLAATLYNFRVSTNTATGSSVPSATASTTTAVVPAPTGLSTGTVTTSTVALSWTNYVIATDTLVEYNGGSGWATWSHASLGAATSATVTGLLSSTSYSFRVSTISAAGTSAPSGTASATTATASVPAPTGLSTGTVTTSTVALSWTNSATPTSTLVEYQAGSGSWNTWSPSPSGSATSVTITGLLAETLYNFRVTTNTATGSSVPSATASTTTAAVPVPTGLSTGTVTTSTVALSWTNNATATDTLVEYNGGSGWATWSHASLRTATSATVTGLLSSTSYSFRVSTITAAGTSAPSGTASATTATASVPPPTGLSTGTVTSSTVALYWTNSATPTSTLVEYQAGSGSWNTWSPAPIGSATTVTVTGLQPATLYNFRVSTNTATGTSVPSATASTTTAVVPPPTGLTIGAATASTVALSWTNNETPADTLVEYNSGSGWTTWTNPSPPLTIQAATVTGLSPGNAYTFRVSTVTATGTSAPSATAGPVTTPGPMILSFDTDVSLGGTSLGGGVITLPISGIDVAGIVVDWGIASYTPGQPGSTPVTPMTYNTGDTVSVSIAGGPFNSTGTISISGNFSRFGLNTAATWDENVYFKGVTSWGSNTALANLSNAFYGCNSLRTMPSTLPPTVTNTNYMFFDCANMTNAQIKFWNVHNVTSMAYMFAASNGGTPFLGDLTEWRSSLSIGAPSNFMMWTSYDDVTSVWGNSPFSPAIPSSTPMSISISVPASPPNIPISGIDASGVVVVWGDGFVTSLQADTYQGPTHDYQYFTGGGDYTVTIYGNFTNLGAPYGWNDSSTVKSVNQWGSNTILASLSRAFQYQGSLTSIPSVLPPTVTNVSNMLIGAVNMYTGYNSTDVLATSLTSWNVTAVTDSIFFLSPDGTTDTTTSDAGSPFHVISATAPTGLTAGTPTWYSVPLSWTNTTASPTDTLIEYNGGAGWVTWAHAALGAASSATVVGLTAGTAYSFRVSTITVTGSSAPSSTTSATTASASPMIIRFESSVYSQTITLPISGFSYIIVDWGMVMMDINQNTVGPLSPIVYTSGSVSINPLATFPGDLYVDPYSSGTITITGDFTTFGGLGWDAIGSLKSLTTWGSNATLTSLADGFNGCSTLSSLPASLPSTVRNVSRMFRAVASMYDQSLLIQNLSAWNVTAVTARTLFLSPDGTTDTTYSDPKSPFYILPPSNLAVQGTPTASAISLAWTTNAADPINTIVRYQYAGDTSWTSISGLGASTSTTVTGLSSSTNYNFQVFTVTALGTSGGSNIVYSMTAAAAATPPTNLATSNPTATTVDLSWTNSTTPIDTTVQFKVMGDSTWTTWTNPGGVLGTASTVTVTGLSSSIVYSFQVITVTASGTSDPSNIANGTTSPASWTPSGPGLALAFNSTASVTLPITGIDVAGIHINWGDGTYLQYNTGDAVSDDVKGNRIVTVYGNFAAFGGGMSWTGGDYLTSVNGWGTTNTTLTSLVNAFYGCSSLTSVPSTIPSGVTDVTGMFSGATAMYTSGSSTGLLNTSLASWNVTAVTASTMFLSPDGSTDTTDSDPGSPFAITTAPSSSPMVLSFNGGGAVSLPINGVDGMGLIVNWGGPTYRKYSAGPVAGSVIGSLTVSIYGNFATFGNGGGWTGNNTLLSVDSWSTTNTYLTSLSGAFVETYSLTSVPASYPSSVTDMSFMFARSAISETPTSLPSSVVNLAHMFESAVNIYYAPSSIPSSVTNVSNMFNGATHMYDVSGLLNTVISWNVANVTAYNKFLSVDGSTDTTTTDPKSPFNTSTIPGVPTAVSAQNGESNALVAWTDPANGGTPITSYNIKTYKRSAGPSITEPVGALLSFNGRLYGVSLYGGDNGFGTIYSTDMTGGDVAVLYSFTAATSGAQAYPFSSLCVDSNSILYGTTAALSGIASGGTLYSFNLTTTTFNTLRTFTETPRSIVLHNDRYICGVTVSPEKYFIYDKNTDAYTVDTQASVTDGNVSFAQGISELIPWYNGAVFEGFVFLATTNNPSGSAVVSWLPSFNPVSIDYASSIYSDSSGLFLPTDSLIYPFGCGVVVNNYLYFTLTDTVTMSNVYVKDLNGSNTTIADNTNAPASMITNGYMIYDGTYVYGAANIGTFRLGADGFVNPDVSLPGSNIAGGLTLTTGGVYLGITITSIFSSHPALTNPVFTYGPTLGPLTYDSTVAMTTNFGVDNGGQSTFTVPGLTNGSTYAFKVAAVNLIGAGPDSDMTTEVTPYLGALPPGAPTINYITAGNGAATITVIPGTGLTGYQKNPGAPFTYYQIYDSNNTIQDAGGQNLYACNVNGLTNGQQYYLYVRAVNAQGQSPPSNTVSVIPVGQPMIMTIMIDSAGNIAGANGGTSVNTVNFGIPIFGFNGFVQMAVVDDSNGSGSTIIVNQNPGIELNVTSNAQSFTISIYGQFDRFGSDSNNNAYTAWDTTNGPGITSIAVSQWGDTGVTSMQNAFAGTTITSVPSDFPSSVTNVDYMFQSASSFGADLSGWNVANVTSHTGFGNETASNPNWPY